MYKEKLTIPQIFGMIICFGGLLAISLSSTSDGTWPAVVLGLIALICFSIRNLCSRSCDVNGLDVYTSGIINGFSIAAIGLTISLTAAFFDIEILEADSTFYIPILGGLSIGIGAYFINQACMTGFIGPSASIANISGVFQLVLDFLYSGIFPDYLKFVGSLIIILGACIIAMGDSFCDAFRQKNKE